MSKAPAFARTPNLPEARSGSVLLTRDEAAVIARVHVDTLGRWIADGRLPVVRLGRKVLVSSAALAAYIERSTTTATSGPLAGHKG
ncbi:helix-turn-helix domain-containing protein [Demequina salsinemoris]|uniref:helix-turn-helix domain-containing protein n=1 Tax=Demequina salsinemoris TaxID=577470 RepID=UPI0007830491|nr:helix-turn-helix domain-containing protein [Demequina salsinemoris]